MKFGFVKSGVFAQKVYVADVEKNVNEIKKGVMLAKDDGVEILTFPYLSITGATCGDLFFTKTLQDGALLGVKEIKEFSKTLNMLIGVSFPFKLNSKLYSVSALISMGKVLGLIPKSILSTDYGVDEKRYFTAYDGENITVDFLGEDTPFGIDLLFKDVNNPSCVVGVATNGEVSSPFSMVKDYAVSGATIIMSPSVSQAIVGAFDKAENTVKTISSTLKIALLSAYSPSGESTSEAVYSGVSKITEKGEVLSRIEPFKEGLITAEIDTEKLLFKREKTTERTGYDIETVEFSASTDRTVSRCYPKYPFIANDEKERDERSDFILRVQAEALKKRIEITSSKTVVLGLSGGLDSTLAILVCAKALSLLNRPSKDLIAVTMPCFGTTSRTLDNSIDLAKALKATLKKVDISKSVKRHLKDIDHDIENHDVTYENAQARERTQVLMDIANQTGGLVVGTGDLSEVALGWSTYNGDHMSMYGVNCSIPKTLVRVVVDYVANTSKGKLKAVLKDILDTPVSPELLPPSNGEIAQKTEDIVGPYVLHDYFLYGMIKHGHSPKKLYDLACNTFNGEFDKETILKWLKIFIRRFFTQQFKRSCTPDGVKVGAVALSPRSEYFAPSDASFSLYMSELENL